MRTPATSHSFVIRLWREEQDGTRDEPLWRGHIIHVPTQEDRYVQVLDDFTTFIRGYLTSDSTENDPS